QSARKTVSVSLDFDPGIVGKTGRRNDYSGSVGVGEFACCVAQEAPGLASAISQQCDRNPSAGQLRCGATRPGGSRDPPQSAGRGEGKQSKGGDCLETGRDGWENVAWNTLASEGTSTSGACGLLV